ncbi:hypothetical protein HPB50_010707 [Hyalomma asiaticum]|uniref:Uncharacterized protein n=1 Tax=Hyalomma asiaticum TaxID=266040 RepID=A0ACB7SDB1_HYAAI|nr:hypothetical protein HPB50_010707 [Hyalomma asiaticum]
MGARSTLTCPSRVTVERVFEERNESLRGLGITVPVRLSERVPLKCRRGAAPLPCGSEDSVRSVMRALCPCMNACVRADDYS